MAQSQRRPGMCVCPARVDFWPTLLTAGFLAFGFFLGGGEAAADLRSGWGTATRCVPQNDAAASAIRQERNEVLSNTNVTRSKQPK